MQGAHHKRSAEPEVGVDGRTDPQTQAQLLKSSLEAARAAPGQRKGRPQLLLDNPGNGGRGRSHTNAYMAGWRLPSSPPSYPPATCSK